MTADRRFPIAIGTSLVVNLVAWTAVGSAVVIHVASAPPPIEIQRVIVDKQGKKTVKVVKPEEVKKKVERVVRERRPAPPKAVPPVAKPAPTPPQGAHNRVITAPSPTPGVKPPDFTAQAGGNAPVGKPTETQAPGNAVVNPPVVAPPPVDPPPAGPPKTPPPADPPKVDPPKADPPKPDPPKKKGPTREAQHSDEVPPTFPDELKSQEFKSFVRVRVEVSADGSFDVVLRTSSGNTEVDKRVLEALKKWKWKPALHDGEPVDSTQLFKFEFEIK